jgi:HD-GYP domain-containing protein (c-di-GMP phosphodiesterase class II)
MPLPPLGTMRDAVLVVERDVTDLIKERLRRETMFDQLLMSLVNVVDRRDPFAADHSQLVASLATSLGKTMGLDDGNLEAVRVAGLLMNLGKVLVPAHLLTREGPLEDEERTLVRVAMQRSAELVESVDFDGPVVETMRQVQERMDGSGGPQGLRGEEILATARILAVSNAFVGMTSERAYRPGLSVDQAIAELRGDCGAAYDPAVVDALVDYLDNRGGRDQWDAGPAD